MHCIDCGVPAVIEDFGVLEVKLETGNLDMPYESISHLEQRVLQLMESEETATCEVGTYNMNGFYSLDHFLKLVQNHDLLKLIASNSFSTHFQPIIDLQHEDRLFAYECLLRPFTPEQSISPYALFEFARDTNLHNYLDQKARECSIVAGSKQKLPADVKLFINFLPSSIYNPEFCLQHTFKIVRENDIAPSQLVFEVVESEKIHDIAHLESIFRTYKKSGMRVALDDVGAGYATLDVLERLQPDFVKIDRSYVSDCDTKLESQLFLKSIISIAHKLDIKVLAEGIERAEELEFCRAIGIHYAQGYYIGKPAPDLLVTV